MITLVLFSYTLLSKMPTAHDVMQFKTRAECETVMNELKLKQPHEIFVCVGEKP